MSIHTPSGQLSTDPLFHVSDLRNDQYEWHEVSVSIESREPIKGCDLALSYTVFVRYTDAGDRDILRVELQVFRNADEANRGSPRTSRQLDTSDAIQAAVASLMWVDLRSDEVQRDIKDEVERHQRDRDEEWADENYRPSRYALANA